jgi:hypothetical protein
MVAEACNSGTTCVRNRMKIEIPEMHVILEKHIFGMIWQLILEIAPFPELAATAPGKEIFLIVG